MDQGIHEAVSRPRCSAVDTAVALAAGLVEGAANSLPMDCNTGRNSVSVPELWLCFAVPLSFSSFEDEGRCLGHLLRAERSGTSPLRHLLQLEGCLQRTARRRAPCGGCQNISRLPQATEYQEYLAGTELEFRLSKQAFCDKSTRWDSIYPRRISQLRIVEFQRADGMAG